MAVPVDVPCRAYSYPWVVPLVDEFLCNLVAVSYEAVVMAVVLHIVIVQARVEELVACCLV